MILPQPKASVNERSDNADARPWVQHSEALADFTEQMLTVRHEVFVDPSGQTQRITRPRIKARGRVYLTNADLRKHFAATTTNALIGLHSTSRANTCLWTAIDVDALGPQADPVKNEQAACGWYDSLLDFGIPSEAILLTSSNGSGG